VSDHRRQVGAAGEAMAARWYEAHGYGVVARNWRCRAGEVDIIARRPGVVVFAEVKTRGSTAFGSGAEAVTWRKQQRLRRLAATWLTESDVHEASVRFDVVDIGPRGVTVIEAAF
jgi:putative endonuclease